MLTAREQGECAAFLVGNAISSRISNLHRYPGFQRKQEVILELQQLLREIGVRDKNQQSRICFISQNMTRKAEVASA